MAYIQSGHAYSHPRDPENLKSAYQTTSESNDVPQESQQDPVRNGQNTSTVRGQNPFGNKDDITLERELLERYGCSSSDLTIYQREPQIATAKANGSKVVVRRVLRTSVQEAVAVDREITALCSVVEASIPILIESLELEGVIWTIKEHRQMQTVAQLIAVNGPVSNEVFKSAVNQLFSGITSIFTAGFAHLRICDQTVCFDNNLQLMITDFQYAIQYGTEKDGDLYAATQEKFGDGLYVAPEVFTSKTYNARKAVIWSCGILIYFMATGQIDKLSNLEHPFFGHANKNNTGEPAAPTLAAYHRRKSSVSAAAAAASAQHQIIHYPGSTRFEVPNYGRWIIPKMLISDPVRRSELIEIASRVPKDFSVKATRPLMELAWLDYKSHVGPMAGAGVAPGTCGYGGGGADFAGASFAGASFAGGYDRESATGASYYGDGNSVNEDGRRSRASSIYSMASTVSNPFRSILGRGDSKRRVSAPIATGGSARWG